MMTTVCFLDVALGTYQEITLYVDGLELFIPIIDPDIPGIIDPDVPNIIIPEVMSDIPERLGTLGLMMILISLIIIIVMTAYNLRNTRAILIRCAAPKKRD
ncbi:MAG: hypothetical protein LBV13_03075 [Methanomassiliicoccaceae archaeon]|jgi:hypothetical protein|nr:hypothetical protein [Methanomassiliicoccaceae archaeon]